MGNESKQRASSGICLNLALIILVMILIALCLTQPPMAEDYGDAKLVREHGSFVSYMVYLYNNWTGRLMATPFMYLNSLNGLYPLVGLANGFALLAAAYLMVALGLGRKPEIWRNDRFFFILSLFVLCLVTKVSESVFWHPGGAVYVWPFLSMLAFLYVFLYLKRKTVLGGILLIVLGFVAGSSQEQVAVASLAFIAFYLLFLCRREDYKADGWRVAALITLLIGAAVLIAAPGNHVRMGVDNQTRSGVGWLVWTGLEHYVFSAQSHVFALIVILGLAASYLSWLKDGSTQKSILAQYRGQKMQFILWCILAAAALSPFVLTGFMLGRTTFMIWGFLTIALISLFNKEVTGSHFRYFANALSVGLLLVLLPLMGLGMRFRMKICSQLAVRDQIIQSQKQQGNLNVTVPALKTDSLWSAYTFINDITDDKSDWRNKWVALYHDLESIRTTQNESEVNER